MTPLGNRLPSWEPDPPPADLESDHEGKVLALLADRGPLTSHEILGRLGWGRNRSRRLGRALERLGGVGLISRQYDPIVALAGWNATPSGRRAVEARRRGQGWDLAVPAGRAAAER